MENSTLTYQEYLESAAYIQKQLPWKPTLAVILGTGLSGLSSDLEQPIEIPYAEIPHFLRSTAPGHQGKLISGLLEGLPVLFLSGRFHHYEGYSFESLALPVRVLKCLGIETLVVTNAAGCVHPDWSVGDLMVITDQINLTDACPTRGANLDEFGPRFFDCSNLYDKGLREIAWKAVKEMGQESVTRNGVYFYMPGPQFESPAEIRAVRVLGGDAVGMSTVTEVLTAAHCGIKVLGFSLMTNYAAGITQTPLTAGEVDREGEKASQRLRQLMRCVIRQIGA